ncbi:MAG: biotin--[acetyl-CoA-carboxylase] ligase [Lachnospiraceae bacterium]
MLSEEALIKACHTQWIAGCVRYYEEIDSTNSEAMRLAQQGAPHGTLVVANTQSMGQGRRGRSWESPVGSTISMTLLLRPSFAPNTAPMLTLVMALAVNHAIRELTGLESLIKWPNDIVVRGKKVCGILTQMNLEAEHIDTVIIGVGINVNQSASMIAANLQQTATSLQLETGHPIARVELIAKIMYAYEQYYDIFLQTEDLSGLQPAYHSVLANLDSEVKVLDAQGEYTGIARGIDKQGELLVQREDGLITPVYAGEVSVRGLYGYV